MMTYCIDCSHISFLFLPKSSSDIDSSGNVIKDDKPTGPNQEWKQPAKTLNHHWQKKCADKNLQHSSDAYNAAIVKYNTVKDILEKNASVEEEILAAINSRTGEVAQLKQATIEDIFGLKPANKLKWFIHARKFTGS